MKYSRLLLGCAVFVAVTISGDAQATDVASRVDDYVRSEMTKQKIPGLSLAVIKDGKPLVVKGYGLANVEHQVPVKPETIFQSGSMGKQFTATAIMLLVEEGKIGLDDTVGKYLTDVPASWSGITIRHLLTHTSGLGDYPDKFDDRKDYTEDDLLTMIKASPPGFKPGERWSYSNLGYVTLGIVIHKVSGKFYGDFLKERVFEPLGMTTTRIISEADIVPNRSAGYRLVKGELKNQEWVSPMLNTTADGSLYWSILDLVKWDDALTKGLVLKPASWAEVYKPVRLTSGSTYPYGFGWAFGSVNGHKLIEHGGAWQGFRTIISRFVDNNLTVIVLLNLAEGNPGKVSHAVAEIVDQGLVERPIRDSAESVTAAHQRLVQTFATENVDKTAFAEDAVKNVVPNIVAFRERYSSYGEIQSFDLLLRQQEGDDTHHRYLAKYKDRLLVYNLWTDKENKITTIRVEAK